ATAASPSLDLPAPIGSLPELTASVAFVAPATVAGAYDVAFDLWLTRDPHPSRATAGGIEVMVWLFYSDPSILPPPLTRARGVDPAPGSFVATTRTAAGGWPVLFLIASDPTFGAQSVTVDLTVAIEAAAARIGSGTPAGLDGLYLEGVDLGSEFAPSPGGDRVQYTWSLDAFSLGAD